MQLVESILRRNIQELRKHRFEFQIERVLRFLSLLYIHQRQFDRMADLAQEIGSSQWAPIVTMAKAAWEAGRRDVALAVYAAADQPGTHQEHLRRKCVELTGVQPPRAGFRFSVVG